MPQQHLAQVEDIPERPDPGAVDPVLGLGGDPLRVEVGLHHIAGKGGADRHQEGHHPGHPGQHASAPPRRHPELAPQVNDHEEEEQLHAPQVQAVEEMPHRGGVPPVDPAHSQDRTRKDDEYQRGQRQHPEHINPRRHIGRLLVGKSPVGRQGRQQPVPDPTRPATGGLLGYRRRAHGRFLPPGNGANSATTNTTIINKMTIKFASDSWTNPQWM